MPGTREKWITKGDAGGGRDRKPGGVSLRAVVG